MVLPMAQDKGCAIAAMMDVLSGVVTGSGFGTGVHGPYQTAHRSGAGQVMIALNIAAFQSLAEFNARMDALIAELKSVPLAQGFEEILYLGELEARADARNRREGLELRRTRSPTGGSSRGRWGWRPACTTEPLRRPGAKVGTVPGRRVAAPRRRDDSVSPVDAA
jgi:hypothetical protein